jgi:cytoskeletal protein RodZ
MIVVMTRASCKSRIVDRTSGIKPMASGLLVSLAWTGVLLAQQASPPIAPQGAQAPADQKPPAQSVSSQSSPQSADSTTPHPSSEPSSTLPAIHVNGGPSADILKSARGAGFKIKVANDETRFCKSEAPVGSRFVSETCIDEDQLKLFLSRTQQQRDNLTHMLGAPGGSR